MSPSSKAQQITLIGAAVNLLLAVCKLVVGSISRSHALIADGIHSLSDLLTDALVLVAAHYGSQAADSEHPYGHRRIETLGSIALAVILIAVALGIMYDAITHLLHTETTSAPGSLALLMAGVSIGANEWLYRITRKVGLQIHSTVLVANAWHHRSDAASSLIVVLGLVGTQLGWLYLDALAAVGVALMIAKMGGMLVWSGLRELIDTSVEPASVKQIEDVITGIPGVMECHQLRTRLTGGKILTDVHVIVSPKISVSEGHRIGEQVEWALLREIEHMQDVVVHIDPEDDEHCAPCKHLPLRETFMQQVQATLMEVTHAQAIDKVVLHYLSGQMHLELGVPLARFTCLKQMNDFKQQVLHAMQSMPSVAVVTLHFYTPS